MAWPSALIAIPVLPGSASRSNTCPEASQRTACALFEPIAVPTTRPRSLIPTASVDSLPGG
ncbi:hypothetical protein [Actinokineospora terrae]|uniref:Uncharacterized protein n=1 Tax=Actinokineospora terrae TaxID=155974 RepID=A0A1H9X3R7_9PSEU|nr:hypothetical protein [Actinokineospora terrae]SES40263.1 hypothetical protein SAMN04487818_112177 [Actinokineospora terrae]